MSLEPFTKGVLVSVGLNALALAAALAVGIRAKLKGRAELAVAVTMLWNGLVTCPVYALGLTNHLSPRPLALAGAAWFGVVYLVARGSTPVAEWDREMVRAAWGLVRLPFDAIVVAARARSLVVIGVIFTVAMLAWTFFCAYLTPSWRQWDALWYHEPIVAFTIQNHGFSVVDLPTAIAGAQKINGYPRLCEMTQLWFVIFTDRRVIDMVGHAVVPALAISVYLLARRMTTPVVAMAFGCALVLMPATAMLIGSVYVDVHNAAFVLAAAHFATRPELRMRDAALAAVCLALAVGSKHMALVPVGMLSLITAVRLVTRARRRPLAALGTLGLGTALIVGTASVTYLRNWWHFGNPFWPEFKYDNDALGIHWPGQFEWRANEYELGESRLDMNLPFDSFLEDLFRIPYSVPRGHYTQTYEYGLGISWLVAPLAAIALLVLFAVLVLDFLGLVLRRPSLRCLPETRNVALLAITLVPMLYLTPALWSARYQIGAVGLAMALVAWLAGRKGFERIGDNVAGALTVMAIISFFWTQPRWWLWWSEARTLASIPYPAREFTPASELDLDLAMSSGSPVVQETGLAREKQLGPGAVVAFNENYSHYMALFWNNEYSNKVVWVPEGPDWLARVGATNATWVYCAKSDPHLRELRAEDSGWQEVGTLQVERSGSVFRRTRW